MRQRLALFAAAALSVVLIVLIALSILAVPLDTHLGLEAGPLGLQRNVCNVPAQQPSNTSCIEPAIPPEARASDRPEWHLKRAHYFIGRQDFPAARAEIDRALGFDPQSLAALHLSARLALTAGTGAVDLARAARDIAQALELAPNDPDIRTTHAYELWTRRAFLEAMREVTTIIARHPRHAAARTLRGQLLLEWERPTEAAGDFEAALAVDPSVPQRFDLVAYAHDRAGNYHAAITAYNAALERAPRAYFLLVGRADACRHAGDDGCALRDLDTLLGPVGGKPNYAMGGDGYAKLLMERATVLVRVKRFDDATVDVATALGVGGKATILRMQIFLRQHGFPETLIDGRDSESFREAIKACFGLDACSSKINWRL